MLTPEEYAEVNGRHERFMTWFRALGRNHHTPEEVPADCRITNEERSSIEVYRFVNDPPTRYTAYVDEKAGTVTTWLGDKLGTVTFGRAWRDNFGGTRVPVWVRGINGRAYHGTYFKSTGALCSMRAHKGQG